MPLQDTNIIMAYRKLRGRLVVIISALTRITLTQCYSLELAGMQKTNYEIGEIISEQYQSEEGYESSSELYKKVIIKGQLVSSSEAAWDALSPKLRCGDDLIKLQLSGPEVAHVELCKGNGAPVTLTQLPPHCGHITPINGGLVYVTPYDGCGVAQQGGRFVMQMQWHGNLAFISCPMTSSTTNNVFGHRPSILLSHSSGTRSPAATTKAEGYMTATEKLSYPTTQATLQPQPPKDPQAFLQSFLPYYYPHYHYAGKVYPTAKPPEKPATNALGQAQNEMLQQPSGSQIFWQYFYPHYHYPGKSTPTLVPTTPTATAVQAQTQKPQLLKYPQMFWPYYYPHHDNPKPTITPVPTAAPAILSVAQAPPERPYPPRYPKPQGYWPFYYPPYPYYSKQKPTEKPVLTSIPTTSVGQAPTQKPQPLGYPQMFWPYYYSNYYQHGRPKPIEKPIPTLKPTTTSPAQEQTQKPQPPGYPQMFWPFYYHPVRPKPTEKPASTFPTTSPSSLSATNQQLAMYPGDAFTLYTHYPNYLHLQQLFSQYSVDAPKSPITPLITTTPQPCTTTVAAECKPSNIQLPKEPPQYSVSQSSVLYEKDPFPVQFVDLSEFAVDSFP